MKRKPKASDYMRVKANLNVVLDRLARSYRCANWEEAAYLSGTAESLSAELFELQIAIWGDEDKEEMQDLLGQEEVSCGNA